MVQLCKKTQSVQRTGTSLPEEHPNSMWERFQWMKSFTFCLGCNVNLLFPMSSSTWALSSTTVGRIWRSLYSGTPARPWLPGARWSTASPWPRRRPSSSTGTSTGATCSSRRRPTSRSGQFFWCSNQYCGSGMIYSGSGSSFEFSEFRIRIQAKVPDPCGSGSNLY